LIAAASADVPAQFQHDPEARAKFFVAAARELLIAGNFRGRQILLGLPAALASIACFRFPAADKVQMTAAIAQAVREKMGMDPSATLIRIYMVGQAQTSDAPMQDVIVIAAPRVEVNRLIEAASQARLDIIGMNVQPMALVDCFSHIYRRRSDTTSTTCFVDIGWAGTRLVVARGGSILSAGSIAIGGADLARAVALAMSISIEEAKLERLKICHADTQSEEHRDKRELHVVRPMGVCGDIEPQRRTVDAACAELLHHLIGQIEQFRDRFTERFPGGPIDRLVFVGGEAQNRALCRTIAREMRLSALVGDPLLRMGRCSDFGFASGIDRREPQPSWAVAIGLSLGGATVSTSNDERQGLTHCHAQRLVHPEENLR
jgi:Tfp pilus assembly PilM family ATPase